MKKCGDCHLPLSRKNTTGFCRICGQQGSRNTHWIGEAIGYSGLHTWVRKHLAKPELCEVCKLKPALDLANKGIYDRTFTNWEWLCRKCHMAKDGRLDKLNAMRIEARTKPISEETRKKMSNSHRGARNFWFGKHLPQYAREKMSKAKKGKTPWNKGLKKH